MRMLFLCLLCLSLTAVQAQQDIYGQFTSPDGVVIKGGSVARGYERQVEITELKTNSGAKSSTVRFVMPSGTATAAFRNAMNQGRALTTGSIAVLNSRGERRVTEYKVVMEGMKVESCTEKTVNGASVVEIVLTATRIGWIYYANSLKGGTSVSSKTGWDFEAQKEWTGFPDK